jgi:hypothetical protein
VIRHFLKHPSFQSARGLLTAVLLGDRYIDSKRNNLDPWAFLTRSLWSIAGIQTYKIIVNIYSNAELELCEEFLKNYPINDNFIIIFHSVDLEKLQHPFLLTWSPRDQMRTDIDNGSEKDLYLYLEHDIDFRIENLNYFVSNRNKISNDLIPGFILVEWNAKSKFWSSFQVDQHDFQAECAVDVDGDRFIPLKQPYCPVILLDHPLAEEFLHSEFFRLESFTEMQAIYGLLMRESAAIGMTYFGRENEYKARAYVGFQQANKFPVVGAVLRHMPNIYSDYENFSQCKMSLPSLW